MVLLSIIDDGVGFDLAEWDRAPGSESSFGLRFMRTRLT
ncbi:hypothetical protein SAMN06298212_10212 [Ruaniaceae bacterium KH17]|nr:hypothetical protein SAMN06298212_10212 [Ruaniaceae bacterium KH17]